MDDDATRAFLDEIQAQRERRDTADAWLYGESVVQAFDAVYGWLEIADAL